MNYAREYSPPILPAARPLMWTWIEDFHYEVNGLHGVESFEVGYVEIGNTFQLRQVKSNGVVCVLPAGMFDVLERDLIEGLTR